MIKTTAERLITPQRQVRAVFDETTLFVYQAYPPQIAIPALAAGRFVAPFELNRMTWIKPSFLWMMYRSGWATKAGQEHILAIRITRAGFDRALGRACLSHYDPDIHASRDEWIHSKQASPVRVQWDPERSLRLQPLPWRTIQVGLSGGSAHDYANNWITEITDISQTVHDLRRMICDGDHVSAQSQIPKETHYQLPQETARSIGTTRST